MADYIYNPAENIKQGFQQTQAGVGNIFTQIIAQQQRDYTLAESAFNNIEALKKDVNIFGQKNITAKSNELLKQAGSAILKDGKIDYSKLGEIRQGISDIKDLKAGYDVGAKEYERMLQLGIANKDNLVSFEKFYKDLSAKMSDENLVKNPQDLQRAMADTYSSNLDSSKMFIKSFANANPYEDKVMDIKDPKTGALMRVEAKLPKGYMLDASGKVMPKPTITTVVNGQNVTMDYADQELARLQSTDPDLIGLMRKQGGFPAQNMSDKDLVKFYIDNKVITPSKSVQVKSADELKTQAAQANIAEFKASTMQDEYNTDKRMKEAQIGYYNSKGDKTSNSFGANNLSDLGINVNKNGKIVNFGGDGIKIDVPTGNRRQAGATIPFKAVRMRTLPDGRTQVGGYHLDSEGKVVTPQLVYQDLDLGSNQINTGIKAAINRLGKADKEFMQAQMQAFNNVAIPEKQKWTKQQITDINAVRKINPSVSDMSDMQLWDLMQKQINEK